jgi:hypothetical protein
MAVCPTWTYRNVTTPVFKSLQGLAKKKGFSIPNSPKGKFTITVAAFNVGFSYSWDSNSGTLLLACETKPMLLGCSTIKSYADKIVVESGGKIGS